MSFFTRFFRWLPSPMKRLRQHLKIEKEWEEFRHHIRPHRFKIYLVIILATYPLYSPYVISTKNWITYQVSYRINSFLDVDRAPFQITDNLYQSTYLVLKIYWEESLRIRTSSRKDCSLLIASFRKRSLFKIFQSFSYLL